jgi:type IV secretory pathway TrbD component
VWLPDERVPAPAESAATSRAFWVAQLGGWAAFGLSTFLTLLPAIPAAERPAMLAAKLLRAIFGLGASLLLRALYRALRRHGVGWPGTAAAALAACVVLGSAWLLAYRLGVAQALLASPPPFGLALFPRAALDLVFVLLAWSTAYFGVQHWLSAQAETRRAAEARHLARDAQLRMLAYQLSPHFLFNALNAVRALVDEDPARARAVVTELAGFLRYTLGHEPSRWVTVREELDVVASYLAIEAIRFEERLRVETEVDPAAAGCLVPSFLIHPLVENAVKHGARGADGVLRLRVAVSGAAGRLRIEVSNTGRFTGRAEPGIGLANVRGRLERSFPGAHDFAIAERDGWVRVMLELPAAWEGPRG